ncbi:helix-turn-helix domain-containing protein [Spirosoma pollinicola]|uniref:AraC family transcriptional regulator n=1 Tax=Spirosoma pollinicola TaxID=2057025 RepID=A0A2K8YWA3_9BACT|nr:AraC family transcriptional regulator [Spirosoma pollinicola]AUD01915.1 AraC family transcriptional regulator [Spirosoma pollinicola]
MTFYAETVRQIKQDHYPKEQLTRQIIKSKQFIDSNFAESIDLDRIAEVAFYSKFHFIRCFKSLYGRTPNQYLTTVRIEKAKQLLQTDDSVTGVCYAVGFDSVTSFSALFKKSTGMTPSGYRSRKKQFSRRGIGNPFGDLLSNRLNNIE